MLRGKYGVGLTMLLVVTVATAVASASAWQLGEPPVSTLKLAEVALPAYVSDLPVIEYERLSTESIVVWYGSHELGKWAKVSAHVGEEQQVLAETATLGLTHAEAREVSGALEAAVTSPPAEGNLPVASLERAKPWVIDEEKPRESQLDASSVSSSELGESGLVLTTGVFLGREPVACVGGQPYDQGDFRAACSTLLSSTRRLALHMATSTPLGTIAITAPEVTALVLDGRADTAFEMAGPVRFSKGSEADAVVWFTKAVSMQGGGDRLALSLSDGTIQEADLG